MAPAGRFYRWRVTGVARSSKELDPYPFIKVNTTFS